MKSQKPKAAADAPEGTIWFGGALPWFALSVNIWSDELDPDEITSLLGVTPDRTRRKGEKAARRLQSAMWSVEMKGSEIDERDVDVAIGALLDRIPASSDAWRTLMERAQGRVFVGLTMDASNRGFGLEPALMKRLSEIGLRLDFDVYTEEFDDLIKV